MSNLRIYLVVLGIAILSFMIPGCDESQEVNYQYEVGAECEIVLRPEFLEGWDKLGWNRLVTPKHTSSNVAGSKESVYGKLVKITNDWIIVSLADIRVTEINGGVRTYGKAGEKQWYEYWVPRGNVLYMRVWKN